MEIIQTIWTALTTENELLITISFIPMIFIELTISMLLFTSILNIGTTKKQKIIYVLALSLIGIISHLIVPSPYNNFINIIMCPLMVILVFKTTILKAIFAEIIPYIFFVIFSSLLAKIFTNITNMSNEILMFIPIYKICFSLLMYLLSFICYLLIKHFKINIKILDNMESKSRKVLIICFVTGLVVIFLLSYILLFYPCTIPWALIISSITALVIYFILTIYSLYRTNKLELTAQDLEEQKLYNKTLTILYDNIRGFRHDFNNIVQSIGGYINSNNIDALKKYYSELLDDCQTSNNLTILNPEVINNPAIYSLLTSKYYQAVDSGIKINLEVFLDLTTLDIKIYEFTRILGVLLDNAIEASSNSVEKIINVVIRKDNRANRSLFIIENTYSNKDVNIDKIFEKGYSSKSTETTENHGLGLWEVRKILKKRANLNLYTTKDDKLFRQQLEIYKENL